MVGNKKDEKGVSAARAERKKYQAALLDFIGDRPVAYHPRLARAFGGVKAGVMLSQLLYWSGDKDVQKRDGWVYKSVDEMEEETGLTKLEQQTARKVLAEAGVIECVLRGIPRVWFYRVNRERIAEVLFGEVDIQEDGVSEDGVSEDETGGVPLDGNPIGRVSHPMENPSNIEGESGPILGRVSAQLNKESETTAEITTERLKHAAEGGGLGPDFPDNSSSLVPEKRTAEERRRSTLEAMVKGINRGVPDYRGDGYSVPAEIAGYPEDVRAVLEKFHRLWRIPVPEFGKKGNAHLDWLKSSRVLRESLGERGLPVLDLIFEDFQAGTLGFKIYRPGSLIKAVGEKIGELERTAAVSGGGTGEGADPVKEALRRVERGEMSLAEYQEFLKENEERKKRERAEAIKKYRESHPNWRPAAG